MMRRVLASVVLWLAAVAALGAQSTATQEIRGRVVAAENGAALPRVRLSVLGLGGRVEPVLADDDGRFVLRLPGSPRTPLRVHAIKAGFATATFEVTRTDVSSARDVRIQLSRGAAVFGRVVDPSGGPVISAVVMVRPDPSGAAARRQEIAAPIAVRTDDLGEYRVGGLAEGRYRVQVVALPPGRNDVSSLNERLLQNPLDLPTSVSETMVAALRPGDETVVSDLVTAPSSAGERCPATPEAASDDPSETASIRGRILDWSGRPLLCATVRLMRPYGASPHVSTDAAGRFAYTGLPEGRYRVEAWKTGYGTIWYGQDRDNPSGLPIDLRNGESIERVDVVLPRRPAVTGMVIDDNGDPVAGVTVRALQLRTVGDLVMAATASGGGARQTDDRGQYRIFGLLPGKYLISAAADAGVSSPDPDGSYGYAPVFYPATSDVAAASAVEIGGAGEGDRSGVNLVFVRSRTQTISGVAFDAAGRAASGVVVFPSQRSSRIMLEPRRQAVAPDGAFSVSNVPAGEYVVQVIARSANAAGPGGTPPVEFGMQYVTVSDRAPAPVIVRATRGSTVEGRIAVRGGGDVPDVTLWPFPTDFDRSPIAGSGPAGFTRLEDGGFRVTGVTGPRRFELRGAPDGWYLASATVNGQDALNGPFDFGLEDRTFTDVEAVLSSAGAGISGRVVDARSAPVTDYYVVVFAVDPAHWFRNSQQLKASRSERDGGFRFSGLPPGEYFVAALEALDGSPGGGGEWQNPAVLDELSSRAQRITLDEREVHRGTFQLLER